MDNWDELQDALEELDDGDKDLLKDHFNACVEDEEDLGDLLFGEKEDFENRVKFLDEKPQAKFAAALEQEELIELDLTK